jgi:hypothetical protein
MQILGGGRATLKVWASSRQRGPEVLFEDICPSSHSVDTDLLEARFRLADHPGLNHVSFQGRCEVRWPVT